MTVTTERPTQSRLLSLDIFRGATIAAMILVNDPGDWAYVYHPLLHAEWHDWTPTDLIFPFFLFIVGVSLAFSFAGRIARGATPRALYLHSLQRAGIIFGLGLFLNGFPYFPLSRIRIFGVLQRIGLVYLLASLIYLIFRRRLRPVVVTIAVLLLGYWALMTLVPVPGFGPGNLNPPDASGMVGNLAAYIDRLFLTGHMWRKFWDPEGLLSTLPAVASTLLGILAGHWLRSNQAQDVKFHGLAAAGVAGLVVGGIWGRWFPINKSLWTSSYTVFTAGFACVVLALCYWLVDIKGWRRWAAPFVWLGTNPLAVFFASTFVAKCLIIFHVPGTGPKPLSWQGYLYQHFFAPLGQPIHTSLAWALCFVTVFTALAFVLYKKHIFIKV